MKIEAGKRYVRRDGLVTGALVAVRGPIFPFLDPTHDEAYDSQGRWIGDFPDHHDLVEEYHET